MLRDAESGDPSGEEGGSTGGCRGVDHWNSFWPSGGAVDDGEEVSEAFRGGQRTHNVDVDMTKSSLGLGEGAYSRFRVAVGLGGLAGDAGTGPSLGIFGDAVPHKFLLEEGSSGSS